MYETIAKDIAFLMRHGHQQYSEIMSMPWMEFRAAHDAVLSLYLDELKARGGGGHV